MKSVFVRRHEAAAIPSCYTNFFKLENSDCPGFEIPLGIAAMASVSHPAVLRRRLFLRGIVQGVGFRPFVYNLAQRHGIRGFVLNSSSGVTIEAEGDEESLVRFCQELRSNPPPLAKIEELQIADLPVRGDASFTIHESLAVPGAFALVSPDVGTCAGCWRDFTDPQNRRYLYPFTNCTNCGPRYTIIRDVPYDRPATTMAAFRMCEQCEAEYHDPGDRRFHAQPNACPACGPGLALVPAGTAAADIAFQRNTENVLRQLRSLLRAGKIVAMRGLGGFHLACDAHNAGAIRELRRRKRRSDKPFALMAPAIAPIESFCDISAADRELLESSLRPIVILPRRPGASIPAEVAPGNSTLGFMLPYTPLHYLVFGDSPQGSPEFTALVMTSGNISEEPIVTSNEEALCRLAGVADWFLLHNRDVYMRTDDSVARTVAGRSRVLRRSRGYAPHPVELGARMVELLACGADLKNTFCLTKDHYAILSQHIGDLENFETLRFFEETLANLKKLFRVEPEAVACDLHPAYMSTRYALSLGLPIVGVQHHHAHIASCMAENGLREPVIGVALDGTGYGTDGQIWGGEFLVADFAGFERRGHFRYVPLAGGDAAVRQPWRSALAYLRDAFADGMPRELPLWRSLPSQQLAAVETMLARGINTVQTSSCGRLFDAVASVIGLRHEVTFEGQAAIELESLAVDADRAYPFQIASASAKTARAGDSGQPLEIDFRPAIQAMAADILASELLGVVSARFHNTVSAAMVEMCDQLRSNAGIGKICLSGGTFQNRYLLERVVEGLRRRGFQVYLHSQVPPNDGGISLGQAVIANEILSRGGAHVSGYSR